MLQFTCPHCRSQVHGDESVGGKLVVCPVCKATMTAPQPAGFVRFAEPPPLLKPVIGYGLYLNWDRLSLGQLYAACGSLSRFLYYFFKKMYEPIGCTPVDDLIVSEANVVEPSDIAPELLAEVERVQAACAGEGFEVAGCFHMFPGDHTVGLLSADGLLDLFISWSGATPRTFFCACTSIRADGEKIVSLLANHRRYLETPPNRVIHFWPSLPPEAFAARHRQAIAREVVIPRRAGDMTRWVISTRSEMIEHNVATGHLFYATEDQFAK